MLSVSQLFCGYDKTDVVKDVSFNVKKGERFCIVGPNGCGKTTMLKAIASLIDYRGSVIYDGQEIKSLKRRDIAKKIAFMTQTSNAYFPYSVFDIVSFGRYARLKSRIGRLAAVDKEIVLNAINAVGLYEKKDDLITTLSGGQFQRAFLARAFAQDPDILLLDEPTNHLDIKCQYDFLEQLDRWSDKRDKTIIMVLHDLNLAAMFAETAVLLENGAQTFLGTIDELKKSEQLSAAFGIDVKKVMATSFERWI